MTKIKGLTLASLSTIALSALVAPAAAQVQRATVSVQGMSCPFCAFGVEKKLRRVQGVGSVEVDLKEGTATVTAAKERSVDVAAMPAAVRKAGFTPGTVEVVVRGTASIEREGEGPTRRILEVAGTDHQRFLLVNLSTDQQRTLDGLAGSGAALRVRGDVHFHADALPGLEPAAIEKVE